MNEYLLRYAIKNVWCNPGRDKQYTYKPVKLTPKYGIKGVMFTGYKHINLPTSTDMYHVYQLGKIVPSLMGLPDIPRQWIPISYFLNQYKLFLEVMDISGIQYPKFETFVRLDYGDNLIFAVKINSRFPSLETDNFYVRFYSGGYFNNDQTQGPKHLITNGRRLTASGQLQQFQFEIRDLVDDLGGYPFFYVNGRFVHEISLTTADVGDCVEYIFDSSIKKMIEFDIETLPTFQSIADSERKYILHYDDPSVDEIEYLDDLEVYLVKPGTIEGRFTGVDFHRSEGKWLRMLTHKDYSIGVERLTSFAVNYPEDPRHAMSPTRWPRDRWGTLNGLKLRVYIRNSGMKRPLGPDSHRIQELYRLTSDQIVGAMTGIDATCDVWKAENLELAPYVRFMSADRNFVYPIYYNDPNLNSEEKEKAQQFVGDVYGYHGSAVILADTPTKVEDQNGVMAAQLAYEHWYNATIFEYDDEGLLLGWHYHTKGQHWVPRNPNCVLIEAKTGKGGTELNSKYGYSEVVIPYGHGFRLYVCGKWNGRPDGRWIDITENEEVSSWGYLESEGEFDSKWVWTIDQNIYYTCVRVDDKFLCHDIPLTTNTGYLKVTLGAVEDHHGICEYLPMDIPMGMVDVILNGHSLTENVDYVLNWPDIIITNREYLNEEPTQRVLVRGMGFCEPDFKRLPIGEVGFLSHGVLSRNCRYDIHTHKVLRVIVDGHYRNPEDLHFDEDDGTSIIEGERNGAPYLIQTPIAVFRDVYVSDREARRKDDKIDKEVSDYMTSKFPLPVYEDPDFILDPYTIISPFCNKLLHDLSNGSFNPPELSSGFYSDHTVKELCKDYEWLTLFDLANTEYDEFHLRIWPHWHTSPVQLTQQQYAFFIRAVDVMLRKPIDLAPFIEVTD